MNVWDAIQQKRAIRQFTDEPLTEADIYRILNAGRRSQSSKNTQPWHFVAIQDRDMLIRLSKLGDYMGHVAGAALCVAIVTPDVEAGHANWIAFDAGQCAAYMQLAAQEIGVGSVIGAVYEVDQARELLGTPADLRCDVVLSFGYPHPDAQQRPRGRQGRRPLEDVVHWDRW